MEFDVALLWYRRDLRVTDNKALRAAVQSAKTVVPVFVWAPTEEGQFQPGRCSRWWLTQSLKSLRTDLGALGSGLVLRTAHESKCALTELVKHTKAQAVFFNKLYDPISVVRDAEVEAHMAQLGVKIRSFSGDVLYEPAEIVSETGQPYSCFQDFWNRFCMMRSPPPAPLPVPEALSGLPREIDMGNLKDLQLVTAEEEESDRQLFRMWTPGGEGAFLTLQKFAAEKLPNFDTARRRLDCDSTSRLSPHIHYGEISVAFVYHVLMQRSLEGEVPQSCCAYLLQNVGYREYGRYLSFHFPVIHKRPLLAHLEAAPFRLDKTDFKVLQASKLRSSMTSAALETPYESRDPGLKNDIVDFV